MRCTHNLCGNWAELFPETFVVSGGNSTSCDDVAAARVIAGVASSKPVTATGPPSSDSGEDIRGHRVRRIQVRKFGVTEYIRPVTAIGPHSSDSDEDIRGHRVHQASDGHWSAFVGFR